MRSPGRTTRTSPTRSSFASTSAVASPRLTSAVSGTSFNSARNPARARSIALSSSASAMEYLVDLMRHLRGSGARRHVRLEVPFFTGHRIDPADLPRVLR